MISTSGLNMYPHTYLMPSGKIFVQANYSTILWDHVQNVETPLPDMPDQVVRVYPASGATAMLPLTPDNNYTRELKLRVFEGRSKAIEFRTDFFFLFPLVSLSHSHNPFLWWY